MLASGRPAHPSADTTAAATSGILANFRVWLAVACIERVALGCCRLGAPRDSYVLPLEHTVPQTMDSLCAGKVNRRCAREPLASPVSRATGVRTANASNGARKRPSGYRWRMARAPGVSERILLCPRPSRGGCNSMNAAHKTHRMRKRAPRPPVECREGFGGRKTPSRGRSQRQRVSIVPARLGSSPQRLPTD
jgi:hypothetical protein